jgi:hypothetical protein
MLFIDGYGFTLDEGLLNTLVFETIAFIHVIGTLGSIQQDLFQSFVNLTKIELQLDSVVNFYHKIGIAWLQFLSDVNPGVLEVNVEQKYVDSEFNYSYPDQDLCLFAAYPQNKSVVLVPNPKPVNCSITLKWLGRNYFNQLEDVAQAYTMCYDYQLLNDSAIDKVHFMLKIIFLNVLVLRTQFIILRIN